MLFIIVLPQVSLQLPANGTSLDLLYYIVTDKNDSSVPPGVRAIPQHFFYGPLRKTIYYGAG